MTRSFFLRAESSFNFSTHIDDLHRENPSDEPEAAMSPARQLVFLKLIHELSSARHAPFLIATHFPILPAPSRRGLRNFFNNPETSLL